MNSLVARQLSRLAPAVRQSAPLHTSAPAPFHGPLEYPNWKMKKDVRVRRECKQYVFERQNLVAMKRFKVLPQEIRDAAAEKLNAMPLNAHPTRMHARCLITSRPRGIVRDWKLSRIVFRSQADYNELSGMQRAMWN